MRSAAVLPAVTLPQVSILSTIFTWPENCLVESPSSHHAAATRKTLGILPSASLETVTILLCTCSAPSPPGRARMPRMLYRVHMVTYVRRRYGDPYRALSRSFVDEPPSQQLFEKGRIKFNSHSRSKRARRRKRRSRRRVLPSASRGAQYHRAMDIKIDGQTFWERLSRLHKSWTVRAPSSCAALPSPPPSAHRRRFCERELSSAPCLP